MVLVTETAEAAGDVAPDIVSRSLTEPAFLITDSHTSIRSAGAGHSVPGSILMTVCRASILGDAFEGEEGEPSSGSEVADFEASSKFDLADDFSSSSFQLSSSPAENKIFN